MPSLAELIQAARDAEAGDLAARADFTRLDVEVGAELAPSIRAEGEKFTALLRIAVASDARMTTAFDRIERTTLALNAARAAVDIARADLDERNVVASEAQAAAFTAAEERNARYDRDALFAEIERHRVTPALSAEEDPP